MGPAAAVAGGGRLGLWGLGTLIFLAAVWVNAHHHVAVAASPALGAEGGGQEVELGRGLALPEHAVVAALGHGHLGGGEGGGQGPGWRRRRGRWRHSRP